MSRAQLYIATSNKGDAHGFAWVLVQTSGVTSGSGAEAKTSSYAMELRAAVEGLSSTDGAVTLVVSETLRRTVTEWMPGWKAAGWKKKKGRIGDLPLVQALDALLGGREVAWEAPDKSDPFGKQAKAAAVEAAASGPTERPPAEVAPTRHRLVAYTDGGCRGNPGVGGWGFLLVHVASGTALEMRGGDPETTNNRMEMLAAISALEALKAPGQDVELRTDSTYLLNMATKWMAGWKRRGWEKFTGEPIKNLDLVQRLDGLLLQHHVAWTWVKGHAGEPGNEHADALTNAAMDDVAAGGTGAAQVRHAVSPVRVPT